jgi:prophage regulatory protein
MTCEPLGLLEVAEVLGVSKQRVHQLIGAYKDFPTPMAELAMGRLWRRNDIEAWAASHPRPTGRPRKDATKSP